MAFTGSFSFEMPTIIEYGAGSSGRLPEFCRKLGARRILVVTDAGLVRLPWFGEMLKALRAEGFAAEVFDAVEPNPKDRDAAAAADAARAFSADAIVAIGGGSPIDCAKVAAILARQGGKPRDYEDRSRIGQDPLPLLSVPTTAGTGSEVTFGAVITDTAEKFKFTVKSPRIAPRYALVDPVLTLSMPPSLTAATGMDALTHAIEAYTSRAAEPVSDACALYAAELIARGLPRAVENGGDLDARSEVLLGSLIAGIAFSHSDVGAVHCIAEALGGMYDIPHGVCNAVCLPAVMRYCRDACGERYSRLGAVMGAGPGAAAAVEFVEDLARRVGLPDFRSFRVPAGDFPTVAAKSAANGSNRDNIPELSARDYAAILAALDG
jgi:alcohol dehydrogenase